jgi:hypothetical protein
MKNLMGRKLIDLLTAGIISVSSLLTGCQIFSGRDIVEFGGGIATGVVIHEGAHYFAGRALGMDPRYTLSNPNEVRLLDYQDKTRRAKIIVNGAGLIAQTIATEFILNSDNIRKDDPYVLGVLTATIGDNIKYGLFPNLFGEDRSDIENLGKNGVDREGVRATLLAHSAYSIHRLREDEHFKSRFNFLLIPDKENFKIVINYNF